MENAASHFHVSEPLSPLPTRRSIHGNPPGGSTFFPSFKWFSALIVAVLSVLAAIGAASGVGAWVSVVIVGFAGSIFASGWGRLSGAPVLLPSQVLIGLSAVAAGVSVAYVQDQFATVFLLGIVLALSVGVEIWTAPAPRDHSQASAVSLDESSGGGSVDLLRTSWVASSATSSLASAVTGIVIAVGGSAWVAMMSTDAWRLLLPIAAMIVCVVVIGDQFGSSWQGQALWAVTAGIISGVVGAVLMIALGQGATLGHLVLPGVAQFLGPQLTVVLLAGGTGLLVASVVIVVDAVFGDHEAPSDFFAALSRGCAKFLLSGLVVYTVIRVAGA